jgi:hypothetical protein
LNQSIPQDSSSLWQAFQHLALPAI